MDRVQLWSIFDYSAGKKAILLENALYDFKNNFWVWSEPYVCTSSFPLFGRNFTLALYAKQMRIMLLFSFLELKFVGIYEIFFRN